MNKKASILVLLAMDGLIIISGLLYSIYSFKMGTKFLVLNTEVPSFAFGLVAIFLGVRYFKALRKLEKEISSPDTKFSWLNFRKSDSATDKQKDINKVFKKVNII